MDFQILKPEESDAYDVAPFLSYARARSSDRAERDPDVGDVVHHFHKGACRPAIITQDDLTSWQLAFLMPGEYGWRPAGDVEHDEAKGEGTWHWPCGGQ